MLADMAMRTEAARTLVYRACSLIDDGDPEGELTMIGAMAKCFASDTAMSVTTDAVQLLGGYGYTKDFPVERFMRDAKITQIYEGTNQIQRVVIAKKLLGIGFLAQPGRATRGRNSARIPTLSLLGYGWGPWPPSESAPRECGKSGPSRAATPRAAPPR